MLYIIWGILSVLIYPAFPIISIISGLLLMYILGKKGKTVQRGKHPIQPEIHIDESPETEFSQQNEQQEFSIKGAYHKRWLFSYNEKNAYYKLKPIAEELGYTVFAKVRLLDLLEPVKGTQKYKTYLYKIQAKHVDFVLCNQKLVAKHIIELDDSSHDRPDRQQRDQFVDQILKSVGYNVIHIRAVDTSIKEQIK